jgi:phosphoglycerol transferase
MKKLNILILSSFVLLSACGDESQPQTPAAAAPAPAPAPAVVTYEATLAQGIDFKKDGYPAFITQVSGMSGAEPWGRWSDADAGGPVVRFTFKDKLPASFKLVVAANAFGPNEGKPIQVKAGQVTQEWAIKNAAELAKSSTYTLKFKKVDGNTLEFTPPAPTSPASLNKDTPDPRKLGIAFVSLKIE